MKHSKNENENKNNDGKRRLRPGQFSVRIPSISRNTTKESLSQYFSSAGEIKSVNIVFGMSSRIQGFVNFETPQGVTNALRFLHDTRLDDSLLDVQKQCKNPFDLIDVWIGGIGHDSSNEEIFNALEELSGIPIMRITRKGAYCFAMVDGKEAADQAVKKLDGVNCMGNVIACNHVQHKNKHDFRKGGSFVKKITHTKLGEVLHALSRRNGLCPSMNPYNFTNLEKNLRTVHLGFVPDSVSKEDIMDRFGRFGKIESIDIILKEGFDSGFAFVVFIRHEDYSLFNEADIQFLHFPNQKHANGTRVGSSKPAKVMLKNAIEYGLLDHNGVKTELLANMLKEAIQFIESGQDIMVLLGGGMGPPPPHFGGPPPPFGGPLPPFGGPPPPFGGPPPPFGGPPPPFGGPPNMMHVQDISGAVYQVTQQQYHEIMSKVNGRGRGQGPPGRGTGPPAPHPYRMNRFVGRGRGGFPGRGRGGPPFFGREGAPSSGNCAVPNRKFGGPNQQKSNQNENADNDSVVQSSNSRSRENIELLRQQAIYGSQSLSVGTEQANQTPTNVEKNQPAFRSRKRATHKHSIRIAQLDHSITKEALLEHFSQAGNVTFVRIVRNESGTNGAYVNFASEKGVEHSLRFIHDTTYVGVLLNLTKQISNRNDLRDVYVDGYPLGLTNEEIRGPLEEMADVPILRITNKNGFCFAQIEGQDAAAKAIANLDGQIFPFSDRPMRSKFAFNKAYGGPDGASSVDRDYRTKSLKMANAMIKIAAANMILPAMDRKSMGILERTMRTVHLSYVNKHVTAAQIKDELKEFGKIEDVIIVIKPHFDTGFAFVVYDTHEEFEKFSQARILRLPLDGGPSAKVGNSRPSKDCLNQAMLCGLVDMDGFRTGLLDEIIDQALELLKLNPKLGSEAPQPQMHQQQASQFVAPGATQFAGPAASPSQQMMYVQDATGQVYQVTQEQYQQLTQYTATQQQQMMATQQPQQMINTQQQQQVFGQYPATQASNQYPATQNPQITNQYQNPQAMNQIPPAQNQAQQDVNKYLASLNKKFEEKKKNSRFDKKAEPTNIETNKTETNTETKQAEPTIELQKGETDIEIKKSFSVPLENENKTNSSTALQNISPDREYILIESSSEDNAVTPKSESILEKVIVEKSKGKKRMQSDPSEENAPVKRRKIESSKIKKIEFKKSPPPPTNFKGSLRSYIVQANINQSIAKRSANGEMNLELIEDDHADVILIEDIEMPNQSKEINSKDKAKEERRKKKKAKKKAKAAANKEKRRQKEATKKAKEVAKEEKRKQQEAEKKRKAQEEENRKQEEVEKMRKEKAREIKRKLEQAEKRRKEKEEEKRRQEEAQAEKRKQQEAGRKALAIAAEKRRKEEEEVEKKAEEAKEKELSKSARKDKKTECKYTPGWYEIVKSTYSTETIERTSSKVCSYKKGQRVQIAFVVEFDKESRIRGQSSDGSWLTLAKHGSEKLFVIQEKKAKTTSSKRFVEIIEKPEPQPEPEQNENKTEAKSNVDDLEELTLEQLKAEIRRLRWSSNTPNELEHIQKNPTPMIIEKSNTDKKCVAPIVEKMEIEKKPPLETKKAPIKRKLEEKETKRAVKKTKLTSPPHKIDAANIKSFNSDSSSDLTPLVSKKKLMKDDGVLTIGCRIRVIGFKSSKNFKYNNWVGDIVKGPDKKGCYMIRFVNNSKKILLKLKTKNLLKVIPDQFTVVQISTKKNETLKTNQPTISGGQFKLKLNQNQEPKTRRKNKIVLEM